MTDPPARLDTLASLATQKSDSRRASPHRRAFAILYSGGSARLIDFQEEDREVVFGRSSKADVQVRSARVSRLHASMRWSEGRLVLRDFGSTNGTMVNSVQIESGAEVILASGDEIALGNASLVVGIVEPPVSGGRRVLTYSQLYERLQEEFERARRHGRPLSMVMLRVGGRGQDRSILWENLASLAGQVDILAEYGPDEYTVLLPETDLESALSRARQMTDGLNCLSGLDVSAGVAGIPGDANGADRLLEEARSALSEALSLRGADRVRTLPGKPAREVAGDEEGKLVVLDPAMKEVLATAKKVARTDLTVLVTGETGVGKEVVALAIHRQSARSAGSLLRINCASIPETLLESELFGHEKGAFTGATRRKVGLFEAAKGGTLLLDEIGELSPAIQAKLLRVMEDHSLVRLGGTRETKVDVRVVAATNRDLDRAVATGAFRRDLFYRLNGFTIHVPPLRERRREIVPMAEHFVRVFAKKLGRPVPRVSEEARVLLKNYGWPGNVRELKNVIERTVILGEGKALRPEHLPERIASPSPLQIPLHERSLRPSVTASGNAPANVKARLEELERRAIEDALAKCGGNRTRAAQKLGISRRSLLYKMKKYSIR
jgi:DNA-binding NtrC family response regulator